MNSHSVLTIDFPLEFKILDNNYNEKYQPFNKLIQKLIDISKCSTVGFSKTNVVDDQVRKSRQIKTLITADSSYSLGDSYNKLIQNVTAPNFKNAVHDKPFRSEVWTALVYEQSSFFSKHTDGQKSENHLCTLLLLPPKKEIDYTGGDLIIYDGSNTCTITANENVWKLVAFPVNVNHECTKIMSGTRIVFKRKFKMSMDMFKMYSCVEYTLKNNSNESDCTQLNKNDVKCEIDKIDSEINNYKKILKQLKQKKINLTRHNIKYDYTNRFDKFNNLNKNIISAIMLENMYKSDDPNHLIGEDYRLYIELVNKYNSTHTIKLHNENLETDMSDEKPNENSGKEPFNRYNMQEACDIFYKYKNNDFKIYFQNTDATDVPGKLSSKRLQYNDSTYDTIYCYKVTYILVIQKN